MMMMMIIAFPTIVSRSSWLKARIWDIISWRTYLFFQKVIVLLDSGVCNAICSRQCHVLLLGNHPPTQSLYFLIQVVCFRIAEIFVTPFSRQFCSRNPFGRVYLHQIVFPTRQRFEWIFPDITHFVCHIEALCNGGHFLVNALDCPFCGIRHLFHHLVEFFSDAFQVRVFTAGELRFTDGLVFDQFLFGWEKFGDVQIHNIMAYVITG